MYCCVGKQYKSGLEILFAIPHTFSSTLSLVTSRHVRRLWHGKKPSLQNKSVRARLTGLMALYKLLQRNTFFCISKTAFDTDDDNTDKTKVSLLLIRTFRDCKLDGRTAEEPGSWENFPGL